MLLRLKCCSGTLFFIHFATFSISLTLQYKRFKMYLCIKVLCVKELVVKMREKKIHINIQVNVQICQFNTVQFNTIVTSLLVSTCDGFIDKE